MQKALWYGILGSFFFAFTFLLNRSMNLSGGYWMWSASLRYLFMLPMLWVVMKRGEVIAVLKAVREKPWSWLGWSTVGFGLFYAPLTLSANYGASWLIAASWQITIVAGILLTPLFGYPIPKKALAMSCLIVLGVFLLQAQHFAVLDLHTIALTLVPISIAAFSYPLGNRKMMEHCPKEMTTIQRVFGMTLCSMPFWLLLSAAAWQQSGLPSQGQLIQSLGVAFFSGGLATVLFFKATDMVKHHPGHLAIVEATQSGEVIFTLLGGILLLGDALPSVVGCFGLLFIIAGMLCNSLTK